ncbi:MAG: dynamin family protein, partial [Chloroflexota bacterium]
MDAKLTNEQEALLKRSRNVLGGVRDTLASSSSTAEEREALAESIRQLDELFLLVVAGEFNAGKSSFVNALLGTEGLLQTGVTPTTSQIWFLKYGAERSEAPKEKGVWVQTAPIPILETLNIVDTPGTNAINREHEALTTDFIPRSDLVLFLTSADRPFSESERQFLEKIGEWGKKIIFVINKMDMFENESEAEQVIQFVTNSVRDLIGENPVVFPVSAKLASKVKAGNPQHWDESGFGPLEEHIESTLDERGRFQLKLLNPIGVGKRLVGGRLDYISGDWSMLEQDKQLLADIEGQMAFYDEDVERNFEARLSEIQTILYEMEQRGNYFFDDTMRIGRIPDLIRRGYISEQFEKDVLKDVPRQIEDRVGELIDWMVEQDLRQWTAVSDHLNKRRDEVANRVVGQGTAQESTLAYDRQRLVDSISKSAR